MTNHPLLPEITIIDLELMIVLAESGDARAARAIVQYADLIRRHRYEIPAEITDRLIRYILRCQQKFDCADDGKNQKRKKNRKLAAFNLRVKPGRPKRTPAQRLGDEIVYLCYQTTTRAKKGSYADPPQVKAASARNLNDRSLSRHRDATISVHAQRILSDLVDLHRKILAWPGSSDELIRFMPGLDEDTRAWVGRTCDSKAGLEIAVFDFVTRCLK